MQAQAKSASLSAQASRATTFIVLIAVIHIAVHALWLILPQFTEGDEVGTPNYVVISATLGIGLVALAAMWKKQRWGWWLMVVVTVANLFLTLPEVFVLEGVLRAGSIVGMVGLTATAVLLFRPELRAVRR